MKTKLHQFITLALLCITSTVFAQPVEKTLVKSFPIEANQTVSLDLQGIVEVKTWENDFLRVQMTITLSNGTESTLKALVTAGRYNLIAKTSGDQVTISAPAMAKTVQVSGKALEDNVTYLVFAPKNATVKLPASTSTSARTTEGGSAF